MSFRLFLPYLGVMLIAGGNLLFALYFMYVKGVFVFDSVVLLIHIVVVFGAILIVTSQYENSEKVRE